mgnify:CR=1 FL=1
MRLDEVIQYLRLGRARDTDELCECFVLETTVTLGDVSRPRSRRVPQLLAEPEVSSKIRATEEDVDSNLHLMRQPPRDDLSEIRESSHGDTTCNQIATTLFRKSFENRALAVPTISETATFGAQTQRNFCYLPNNVKNNVGLLSPGGHASIVRTWVNPARITSSITTDGGMP